MVFYINTCNQCNSKERIASNMIDLKNSNQDKIDSVIVKYWKSSEAIVYTFYYSNKALKIGSDFFNTKKIIEDKHIKQVFIRYIDQLYIDKEDKIILKRTKRGYLKSTDYPYIKVIGYRNKKEIFNLTTQVGEEEYDVEYSPKFIEFYEFLDGLVSTAPKRKPNKAPL